MSKPALATVEETASSASSAPEPAKKRGPKPAVPAQEIDLHNAPVHIVFWQTKTKDGATVNHFEAVLTGEQAASLRAEDIAVSQKVSAAVVGPQAMIADPPGLPVAVVTKPAFI